VRALPLTRPFAVWRLWLDRAVEAGRAPFAGTTGFGRLDNISVYDHFQDESRAWAEAARGAVVELHAYAVEPDADQDALRAELLAGLHALYPETRAARVRDERFLWRQDCAGFPPGAHAARVGVATPHAGVTLAGDFARLPVASALMERAATSGMMAANLLLTGSWREPEPIESLPARGLLAGLFRRGRGSAEVRP
jgi:isorenieratene synthase